MSTLSFGRRPAAVLFRPLLLVFCGSLAVINAATAAGLSTSIVIPRPVSLEQVAGVAFVLSGEVTIDAEEGLAAITRHTTSAVAELTGQRPALLEPRTTPGAPGRRIHLALRQKKPGAAAGGYRLQVRTAGILAEADSPEGLFHATQTLRQLAMWSPATRQWTIPLVDIEDEPRFKWRGLLVDVAAHFYPKEELKRIIDTLACYKMNVLHLHLTDYGGWRVEIPRYPRLTTVGGKGDLDTPGVGEPRFYTTADLKEIVAYAAANFVTVVPEIEMPGHAGAAERAYPEYFDGAGTFNPAAPGVYDFIAAIATELAEIFPGPIIHFGGDEVSNERWSHLPEVKAFMQAEGLKNNDELQRYFYARVAGIIQSAGRRPMAWDETAEAGVGPEVAIQWWRKARPEVRDAALAKGHELVLSPVDQVYLDYAAGPGEPGAPWEGNDNGPTSVEKILRWEPIPSSWSVAQAGQILGVEAALWTQFMRTEGFLEFMLYPRLMAVAEVAWSPRGPRDAAEFRQRLGPHVERLRQQGINARVRLEDVYRYLTH